jgi:hypothetical protein
VRTLTSEVREQQIEWRRSQILELASQGYNQREICQKLQLDKSAVNRDIQLLRRQAQENLKHHIQEVVPEEYQKAMVGIKSNLKQTLEIAETVSDPKVKLQARSIANECYHSIIDLVTNSGIVSEALNYVEKRSQQLSNLQKASDKIDNLSQTLAAQAEEPETETVSDGIF